MRDADKTNNEVSKLYTVAEIATMLSISQRKAYDLCSGNEFKVIRIGRSIRVNKESFDAWFLNL